MYNPILEQHLRDFDRKQDGQEEKVVENEAKPEKEQKSHETVGCHKFYVLGGLLALVVNQWKRMGLKVPTQLFVLVSFFYYVGVWVLHSIVRTSRNRCLQTLARMDAPLAHTPSTVNWNDLFSAFELERTLLELEKAVHAIDSIISICVTISGGVWLPHHGQTAYPPLLRQGKLVLGYKLKQEVLRAMFELTECVLTGRCGETVRLRPHTSLQDIHQSRAELVLCISHLVSTGASETKWPSFQNMRIRSKEIRTFFETKVALFSQAPSTRDGFESNDVLLQLNSILFAAEQAEDKEEQQVHKQRAKDFALRLAELLDVADVDDTGSLASTSSDSLTETISESQQLKEQEAEMLECETKNKPEKMNTSAARCHDILVYSASGKRPPYSHKTKQPKNPQSRNHTAFEPKQVLGELMLMELKDRIDQLPALVERSATIDAFEHMGTRTEDDDKDLELLNCAQDSFARQNFVSELASVLAQNQ